jgi:AraC-like DNA-binding protein
MALYISLGGVLIFSAGSWIFIIMRYGARSGLEGLCYNESQLSQYTTRGQGEDLMQLGFLKQLKDRSVFLISLGILLASVVAFFLYDLNVRSEYKNERMFYYEKNHEKAFSSFSLFSERVNSIYRQLLLNRNLTSWLNNPGELIGDMYKLSEIQNSFIELINTNSGLVSMYLHNNKNNMVLSTPFMLSELPGFPNKELFDLYYKGSTPIAWLPYGPEMRTSPSGTRIISMIAGIPSQGKNGAVAVNVNEAYIAEQLMDDNPYLLWLDENNQVLLSRNEEAVAFFNEHREELIHRKMTSFLYKNHFIIFSDSDMGKWRLLTILPEQVLEQGQSARTTYLFLLLGLSLVMGVLLILYFQYVRRAQDTLLEGRFRRTVDDSQKSLLLDLLNGKPAPHDLAVKLEEYQMQLDGAAYQVIVFQLDNYYNYLLSKTDQERFLMNKMIYNSIKWTFALKFRCYTVSPELDKVTVLLIHDSLDVETASKLDATIRYMQDDIHATLGLTVCAGVSGTAKDRAQLHSCNANALLSLHYKAVYGKHALIYYDQLPTAKPSSYAQLSQEIHKITDDLREGRLDRIELRLNEILDELKAGEHFLLDWMHAIFANIMSAIMKYVIEQRIDLQELRNEDVFMTLYSYEFLEEKKAYVLQICELITRLQQAKSEEKKSTSSQLIIDYIDKHFDQPISLGIMADQLSLSPSYLSVVIKNQLGMGFVEYINKLRIQKAVSLLEDNDVTIQQIAEQCGYDTVHTFIRQFKKMYQMPPNEYRIKRKAEKI